MKFISWNVNGLRACIQKGFLEAFQRLNADFFCLQETKLQEGQLTLDLPGYFQYWNYAEKKGYSGTAVFTKHEPRGVTYGVGVPELDTEGRVITLEYDEFFLVTCYTPNAQRGLARLNHRLWWETEFRKYMKRLDERKPVILCGDLNVAHKEIDLKNPASNRGSAGFSDQEREAFGKLLECGFTDTFRHLHPDAIGKYTWWSYMYKARENNAGWRIDYFLTSQRIRDRIYKTPIYSDIMGSDHCPVGLQLDTTCNGGLWSDEITDKPTSAEPEKSVLPPMSPSVKAGVAAGIFAVGFAAGTLVDQMKPAGPAQPSTTDIGFYVPETPTQGPISQITIPQGTTSGGNFGIADDFASMSTMELIDEVLKIKAIINIGENHTSITKGQYDGLKKAYPVLAELEQREDAIYLLGFAAALQSDSTLIFAAFALQTYYKNVAQRFVAAPGEVLIGETDTLKVYEQTQKMTIGYTLPMESSSIFYPTFYAGDREFPLSDHDLRINPDTVNFYVRIVATDVTDIISPLEVLVNGVPLEQYGSGDIWIRSAHCMNPSDGIFLFGHISEQVRLDLTAWFAGGESGSATIVYAAPVMEGFPNTEDLARYLCAGMIRWQISDDELQAQPVFTKLLEQSNCIEALYHLATSTSFPHRNVAYNLLIRNDFQRKMTDSEKQRFAQLLSGLTNKDYFIPASMTSRPELVPVGESSSDPYAYYVHTTQGVPDPVQLEQYDCFVKVELRPAGKILYDKNWTLQGVLQRESDGSAAESTVWEVYDATGENLTGWIVAAKLGGEPAQGKFQINSLNGPMQLIESTVFPVGYDYSLDDEIFVDSSSSLFPIS